MNTDYQIVTPSFENCFCTIIPGRQEWDELMPLEKPGAHIFTDGSKLDDQVGGGDFSEDLNIIVAFRLPDHCSVYQAEVMAIKVALEWLRCNEISTRDICIFIDSQAAIKSLNGVFLNSKVALNCQSSLNEREEKFDFHLIWVPGHRNNPRNYRADELARKGTVETLAPEYAALGILLATCKL